MPRTGDGKNAMSPSVLANGSMRPVEPGMRYSAECAGPCEKRIVRNATSVPANQPVSRIVASAGDALQISLDRRDMALQSTKLDWGMGGAPSPARAFRSCSGVAIVTVRWARM